MYIPKTFQQNDPDNLRGIMRQYPFASLVTFSEHGLDANHIPFVLDHNDGKDVLRGHIAKVNPLWKNLTSQPDVMVIFSGPNCYVSPNYYPTKQEHGKAVPTWNYVIVHVRGEISFVHDKQWNLKMINDLTDQHESESESVSPWSVSDAPESYIDRMLSAIVGIEIEVQSITGQWKLSQNQPEKNKIGVVTELSLLGDQNSQDIAELVKVNSS